MTNAEMIELLELAAKAAGYPIHSDAWACGPSGAEPKLYIGSRGPVWNPVDDDGDSRRLQVACGIDLIVLGGFATAYGGSDGAVINHPSVPVEDDPCAAARLAVLRVAAAIGRAMP